MPSQYILKFDKMKSCCFILFVVTLTNYVTCTFKIGDVIDVCDIKDPQFNQCLIQASNKMVPVLTNGIEEFGMQVLDPLRVATMSTGEMRGSISLELLLYDTTQRGLSQVYFDSAKFDPSKGLLELNGTLPHFHVQGRYKGKGRLVMLPMANDGKADLTLNNTKMRIRMEVESVKIENVHYLRIKKFKVSYDYDKVNISLSALFSQNKRLAEAAQRLLNLHSKDMFMSMHQQLAENYGKIFSSNLQKFFYRIPLNELFLNL